MIGKLEQRVNETWKAFRQAYENLHPIMNGDPKMYGPEKHAAVDRFVKADLDHRNAVEAFQEHVKLGQR